LNSANRTSRSAYVVGPFGDGTRARRSAGGTALPYGAQFLEEHGFEVTYVDPSTSPLQHNAMLRLPMRVVHRLARGPVLTPALEPHALMRADLLVCIFEDNLRVLVWLVRLRALLSRQHNVLMVCWLTQTLAAATPRQRRRWRKRVTAFDSVLVFSSNQVQLLTEALDLPVGLVRVVPFGVSLPERAPVRQLADPGGAATGLVLTVGSDVGRDFATFVQALDGTGSAATIVTNSHHAASLRSTGSVNVIGPISRSEYLTLLDTASIVVCPTQVLLYPTGQTALLEAMAMGKPCVVTRSAALDDYVTDGVDVLLVPAHDAAALREAVRKLQRDPALARRLGTQAHRRSQQFTERAMWAAVVDAIGQPRAASAPQVKS
jgi:glycosyltransferase involved in cell wall biosynthesis